MDEPLLTAADPLPPGYHEWPLPPALREHIEACWTFRATAAGQHCVPPDGRIDLVLRATLDAQGRLARLRAVIAGPGLRASWVPVDARTVLAGLRFVPGWGGACLGLQPEALRGRTLLGAEAERVVRRCAPGLLQLADASALPAALLAAGQRLAAAARPTGGEARAARAAALLAATPELPLSQLARQLGTSVRTLRREVAASIGLPLQTLLRLQRLHCALRLQAAEPPAPLARVAAAAGYSDQAHMTRDFRHLAGATPARRPVLPLITIRGLG